MNIFEFDKYKNFIQIKVRSMPRRGRGEYRKIAQYLRIHTTMASQIIGGDKHLNIDQALSLAQYFGLKEIETDYFMGLVEYERATTTNLKKRIKAKLTRMREQAIEVGFRLPKSVALTESDQAIFYSHWYYSAIRLLTSIGSFQNVEALSEKLDLPRQRVSQILEFLLRVGLCKEVDGRIQMGPSRTYLESDSPLIARHHANWRLKAIEKLGKITKQELNFTSALTVSIRDVPKIREVLAKAIEEVSQIVESSSPDQCLCLNIDWFSL